jgi:hypothetical protein
MTMGMRRGAIRLSARGAGATMMLGGSRRRGAAAAFGLTAAFDVRFGLTATFYARPGSRAG